MKLSKKMRTNKKTDSKSKILLLVCTVYVFSHCWMYVFSHCWIYVFSHCWVYVFSYCSDLPNQKKKKTHSSKLEIYSIHWVKWSTSGILHSLSVIKVTSTITIFDIHEYPESNISTCILVDTSMAGLEISFKPTPRVTFFFIRRLSHSMEFPSGHRLPWSLSKYFLDSEKPFNLQTLLLKVFEKGPAYTAG